MPNVGLYFPYINFRDEQWVKNALLFWPSIARIIPEQYGTSNDIVDVIKQHIPGFLEDYISYEAIYQASRIFSSYITDHIDEIQTITSLGLRRLKYTEGHNAHVRHEEVVAYIHLDKMDMPFVELLEERDLGIKRSANGATWLAVDRRLGQAYMTLLASKISEQTGFLPLTDNKTMQMLISTRSDEDIIIESIQGRSSSKWRTNGNQANLPQDLAVGDFMSFIIKQISIKGLQEIPLERVIEFRLENERLILDYKEAIDSVIKNSKVLDSCNEPRALPILYRALYKDKIKNIEESYAESIRLSSMDVKFQQTSIVFSIVGLATSLFTGNYAATLPQGGSIMAQIGRYRISKKKLEIEKSRRNPIPVFSSNIRSLAMEFSR